MLFARNRTQLIIVFSLAIAFIFLYTYDVYHQRRLIENKETINITCVGDSITKGSGATDRATTSYPACLQKLLSDAYNVTNFGYGGRTAQKISDSPYYSCNLFYPSLSRKSDIIVFQFGTNDAKFQNWNRTRFITDYSDIIWRYKRLPTNPKIFVCIPPPIYANDSVWNISASIVNNLLPKVIPEVAKITGSILIDNFQALGGHRLSRPELFYDVQLPPNDGVHPNDKGYRVIAKHVHKSIMKQLKRLK